MSSMNRDRGTPASRGFRPPEFAAASVMVRRRACGSGARAMHKVPRLQRTGEGSLRRVRDDVRLLLLAGITSPNQLPGGKNQITVAAPLGDFVSQSCQLCEFLLRQQFTRPRERAMVCLAC